MSGDTDTHPCRVRALTPEELDMFYKIRARAYNRAPELTAGLYTVQPVHWEEDTWAMDGKGRVYLNFTGKRTSTWTEKEHPYLLIHEIWHLLRRHHERHAAYRRANPQYIKVPWNECADFEINDDIRVMPGAEMPKGVLYPDNHGFPVGLTAEQYLDLIEKRGGMSGDGEDGMGGGDSDDDSDGQGGACGEVSAADSAAADAVSHGLSDFEKDFAEKQTAAAIAKAIAEGTARGRYSADQQAWALEVLAPPKVSWKDMLRTPLVGHITAVRGSGKATYWQPSRRYDSKVFIMPGRRRVDPNVLVALDTSSSMLDGSIEAAVSETTHILRSKSVKHIQVMNVTTVVNSVSTVRGQTVGDVEVGGGTDMRTAYTAVAAMEGKNRPTNFILLTDGETPFPEESDAIPGVKCLVGIINTEEYYDHIVKDIPSWITPVWIPREMEK